MQIKIKKRFTIAIIGIRTCWGIFIITGNIGTPNHKYDLLQGENAWISVKIVSGLFILLAKKPYYLRDI